MIVIDVSFFLEPICKEDLFCEINELNLTNVPGHDSISGKVIQLCPEIFAYPDALEIDGVVAFFKKGNARSKQL